MFNHKGERSLSAGAAVVSIIGCVDKMCFWVLIHWG